jgi:hypothetical protein
MATDYSQFANSTDPVLRAQYDAWKARQDREAAAAAAAANAAANRDAARTGLAGVQDRPAPQADRTQIGPLKTGVASQLDSTRDAQARQIQMDLAARLQGVASGQQKGAGEIAVNRQVQQGLAAQMAQAASQRGGNAALAARGAARNAGAISTTGAGQAQQAALGDQAAANQALAGVAQGMRGQDIDVAGANANLQQQMNIRNLSAQDQKVFQQAGLDQSTSLSNMQARLQAMGMNDQAALGYLGLLFGWDTAQLQAALAREANSSSMAGNLLQAGGALGAAAIMSDRRLKKRIRDASRDVDEMLDALKPQSYEYRDEKHGKGERAGIMAQDMERSRMGRAVVTEQPYGKALDVGKAISAGLAAVARLNERLKAVEGKKG